MDTPLWGKQTELARSNFPIANRPLDVRVARALATIKRHAAAVNAALGVGDIDDELAGAIAEAAEQVERGELDDQFPVDIFQTGSGTSTNMNVNEVLATLVEAALDDRVPHPNDHINASPVVERHRPDGDPAGRRPPARRRGAPGGRCARRVVPGARRAFPPRGQGGPYPPDGRHPGDAGSGGRGVGGAAGAGAGALRRPTSSPSASCPSGARPSVRASTLPRASPSRWSPGSPPRPASRCEVADDPMVHMGGQGALAEASAGLRGIAIAFDEDRQRHPSAGQRAIVRVGRAAAPRTAGGIVDHAREGQPGALRVGQPGGGPGVRQRRHGGLRVVAGDPRAEHVPPGDGRSAAAVG